MNAIGSIASSYSLSYSASIAWASASIQSDPETNVSVSDNSKGGTTSDSTANATTTALASLRDQIESAISSALDGLDDSATAKDVLSTIRQAVTTTLEANGIYPSQARGRQQSGCGGEGSPDASGSTDDSDPTAKQRNDASFLMAFIGINTSAGDEGADESSGGENSHSDSLNSAASSLQQTILQSLFGTSAGDTEQNLLFALVQQGNASENATGTSTFLAATGESDVSDTTSVDKVQELVETLLGTAIGENEIDITSLFSKLFANFPNGTAFDAQA